MFYSTVNSTNSLQINTHTHKKTRTEDLMSHMRKERAEFWKQRTVSVESI